MRPGNPTTDDLIAEMGDMGILDLVEGICRDHGASVTSIIKKGREPHIIRARSEVIFALRSIVDDLTGRHRYSLTAIGNMLDRDHTSVMASLETRAAAVLAFAKKHGTEPAVAVEKLAAKDRRTAKAIRPSRAGSTSPEVHVWVVGGVEQTEPVDQEHPVLADGGGNLIAIGRVYRGRTYAGRRAVSSSAEVPDAPASGSRARTEAA